MSKEWSYVSGDWNAVCDSCGRKMKASKLRKRWDGLMVCDQDFETRHPLDFIRARQDKISVPWSRPQSTDIFLPDTHAENESILFSELTETMAAFYRSVGVTFLGGLDVDVVNGSVLNLAELNHSSVDSAPPSTPDELFALSETVVTSSGTYISVSDSVTLSETVVEGEGEVLSDNFTFNESVFATIITNRILNGHLSNGAILG